MLCCTHNMFASKFAETLKGLAHFSCVAVRFETLSTRARARSSLYSILLYTYICMDNVKLTYTHTHTHFALGYKICCCKIHVRARLFCKSATHRTALSAQMNTLLKRRRQDAAPNVRKSPVRPARRTFARVRVCNNFDESEIYKECAAAKFVLVYIEIEE